MYLKDSNIFINLNHIRSIYNDKLREQIFLLITYIMKMVSHPVYKLQNMKSQMII
jgi:hypothetical protein